MNINTFRIIYHGAVMNDDGTLHWDHFADALQKYDPSVDLFAKRGFFNEMAGADGHLTWAKVENWFNHHQIDIQTFRKIYDRAVLNADGTLHWDHYADALRKYHPDADLESKRALFNEVAGYDGKLTWPKVEDWFMRHKVEIKTLKPMTIDTFSTIYNGAVMNNDGTLHWDHFADALKKYDPNVDLTSKRHFFDEMAKPDGHLTWTKVENWFNNHRVDIQTFRKIYDRAVLNADGTLHWDHYADALRNYDPTINLESKRALFEEMAAPDGHLTWAKVENWYVNHRLTVKSEPTSTYQYKTACAGGAGSTGYGGPLCAEPFGQEVQNIANQILKDSEKANNLCYNNFTDPCPELTKAQIAACKGFDYADKTLKCPFGPIPWPAGTPEAGYVPKTNPLTGRWITVTGGDAEFIKKSIQSGMLGGAEAEKIKADVDTKKTGGMYLRITQNGEVCTVDASVAKFARAMRTWKSGHYFYEPLVSGGNLFGVWVLPEEYRKIGFFWEMNSGKVFRIQRNAWMQGGYMFMRQSTEAFGRISHVLYVKVSNDPESGPKPQLQSRDYTALAGVYNAPDNLGKHYPCTPIDLDAPVQRDTWMDSNIDIVTAQQNAISSQVGQLEKGQSVVGYGWKSQGFTCSHDAVFEALQFKARNPEKFMDVSDVVIKDEPGYVSRTMFIKPRGITVSERIIINRLNGELVFQPVNSETGRLEHEERVIAVHDDPYGHLEYYQRDSVDGMRTPWTVPVSVVESAAAEVIAQAIKLEESVDPVVGLGTHSDPVPVDEASHDDLWKALVSLARDPYFMVVAPVSSVNVKESDYIERKVEAVQRIYINEELQEIVFRSVANGEESLSERAIILRAHPVELELCERRVINGFRIHSKISKAKAMASFDTVIKCAKRLAEEPPTTIGLGATSAPLTGVAYPSLFAAVDKTIAMPWLIQNVKESECSGSDCQGYYSRSMKMPHTGEVVREQIKIDEEKGEVVFTKLGRDSRPSDKQRVLCFRKDPLRIEFFERSARTGARVEWAAPYRVATDVFTKLTDIAREFEANQHGIVGYGMVSHAYTCSKEKLWKAMSAVLRDPSRFGIKVDQVMCQDQQGFLKRSYRIISQNRTKVENVRINESAQEFIFKTIKDGRESEVEHVWTLATNPLRCEIHGRKASDQMRVRWELPQEQANEIFDAFVTASSQV